MFYFAPLYEEWVDASKFDIKEYENGRGKSNLRFMKLASLLQEKKKIEQDAAKIKLKASEL